MKLLKVDTIDQAREKMGSYIQNWQRKTKTVSCEDALNQISAEDIYALCDIPSFRRSTVDGYAVAAKDTAGADESVPVFLNLAGKVQMGKEAGFSIISGECAYVPTGGMLPEGADAVVMIEYTDAAPLEQYSQLKQCSKPAQCTSEVISIYKAVSSGTGMTMTGEDFQKGELLLKKGSFLRPQEIGALCAAGITNINVLSPLTLSIISTGDELVSPPDDPAPGQIRDINTKLINALAVKHGFQVISSQVIPDDEEPLRAAASLAAASSDVVIISGGSSQGEKDFTASVISRIAKPGVFTHGLAVKPGKPAILGWDEESKTLFAGLPGHPVSAMMVFTLLFNSPRFSIRAAPPIPAVISCNVPGSPGKTACVPVTLKMKDGIYTAEPVFGKAGMISVLTRADGYIEIDINKEGLKKDEQVFVNLL